MSDESETVMCPHCGTAITIAIDYDVDVTVHVESHEAPPDVVKTGGHPSEKWTREALDAIPVAVTKVR